MDLQDLYNLDVCYQFKCVHGKLPEMVRLRDNLCVNVTKKLKTK